MSAAGARGRRDPSLGVVVPVYDEAATVGAALREIAGVAADYPGVAVVIAVDDGSSDGSAELLDRLAIELQGIVVVHHHHNSGYGAAVRTGVAKALELGLDYVAFIDSDRTNPPTDLLRIGRLAAEGHDYIKASRFVPGGRMEGVPWRRRIVSAAGNSVGRALFGGGVRDVTNGFRAGRTSLLASWPTRETGFAVIVEELDWALRTGVEPVEFATVLRSRTDEQRPTAFAYSPRQIRAYLRYPMRALGRRARRSLRRGA